MPRRKPVCRGVSAGRTVDLGRDPHLRLRAVLWTLVTGTGIAAAAAVALAVSSFTGSLISVNPLGASSGVAVQITGSGFDSTASRNQVTFTPLAGGTPQSAFATAIATLDAAKGIRRLNLLVPAGLPAGTAALRVTNTVSGEVSEGLTLEVLHLTLPDVRSAVPGATGVKVVMAGSPNTTFTNGTTTRVVFGAGVTVRSVLVENPQRLIATIDVSPSAALGPRSPAVRPPNQSLLAIDAFTIGSAPPANQQPTANANGPYGGRVGEAIGFTSKGSSDPDGDTLTFAWDFGDGTKSSDENPAHAYASAGQFNVSLTVSDGRGGSATSSTTAAIEPAVALTGINVDPAALRFSSLDATRSLQVIGSRSDNSAIDLTAASTGTIYSSSHPFVASVSPDGVVTARGNGEAVITAANGGFQDSAAIVVEAGVTLDALALTPVTTTLRLVGATQSLVLMGTFSDGSVRDLTNAVGTTYRSDDPDIASVSSAGLVVAAANGVTGITASHGDGSATAEVTVAIPQGLGFIRGAAFDDGRGLPLPGATATLLSDGGGIVDPQIVVTTDDTGRYALQGRAGDAIVRVRKDGFTTVDRAVVIPASGVSRVFDARLTPIDSRSNPVQSAFGGPARDGSGATTLAVQPGSLAADTDLRLTPLSAQGLAGLLPPGWSPVAAAEVRPLEAILAQPATLTMPNVGGATAGSDVTIAAYDRETHRWVAAAAAPVSADGRSISLPITSGGHFVALLPDAAPHTPPTAVPGTPLAGVPLVGVPTDFSADGEVVPRAAPPGDKARAVGRVGIGGSQSIPSGASVQVHVTESFELLDSTAVVPLPYTQDIVLHARPRPPTGGSLGATFPITPSRTYTIQELMRGVVKLDVAQRSDAVDGTGAGPQGAVITNADGDSLTIPGGALQTDTIVHLARSPAAPLDPLTPGFTTAAAFEIDIIGASLSAPGQISTAIPAGVSATDQILLVQSFIDPLGARRLRVAGIGRIEGSRLVSDHQLGTLVFPGVTANGPYSFIKSTDPLGFVTGVVTGGDGATPAPLALVTSSNTPFVDVTGVSGRYVVAARAGADGAVAARHLLSSDTATAVAHPAARDAIVELPLTLAVAPPSVLAVAPAAGATNVPLDTSITVDFSEPIDPATITDTSVFLQAGGAGIAVSRTLSQDARRLTLRPDSPLLGKTTYVLSLTSEVKDRSGAPLVPFTPVAFTTLDPTKPPQPPPGQIVASLPDEGGVVLVVASAGTAEAASAVTATNVRTQETFTVLALVDGSFLLRIGAVIGDEIILTLRDAASREATVSLTQFEGEDGSTSIGQAGGSFRDAESRRGSILPRALVRAGIFAFGDASPAPSVPLSGSFSYVDRFGLATGGGEFNRIASLTLTESQGRFAPATVLAPPFEATGELTVPADFLTNAALRYSAVAQDLSGQRRSVTASTTIVSADPVATLAETAQSAEFPALFLTVPREALQNQVIGVRAVAPAARIELQVPSPASPAQAYFLTRVTDVAGAPKLALVDVMTAHPGDAGSVLRTSGAALPGMTASGEYAVVGSSEPLVLITGQLSGAAGTVAVDGLPFVFETGGPNGRFTVPARPNGPFTLEFFDADGSSRGTATGEAPALGSLDVGNPLGAVAGQLSVSIEPDPTTVIDIAAPIVLRFSSPVDVATLPAGVIVTDAAGARVYGAFASADAGRTVQFRPTRRWRYATTYRVVAGQSIAGLSGARLSQPVTSEFTTFTPAVIGAATTPSALEIAVSESLGVAGTASGISILDMSSALAPHTVSELARAGGARGASVLPSGTLVDRNGQQVSGTIAVVVSGDASTGGRLEILDLSVPSSPSVLGAVQLTAIPGQLPPSGVPDVVGTPRQVILTPDNRAIVAVQDLGVLSVSLGQAIPNQTANPGGALGPRYPASGAESVTGVALLGDRIVATSAAGLTVLDSATLERRGGTFTGSSLLAVDAVSSFVMDVNGDGAIAATEVFDLVVAAGGGDGTVQFFAVPKQGDPVLISVVRVGGETTSVVLSAEGRLAYVGNGVQGAALVDLDGPARVQSIDLDRNGVDDRLLGSIDVPGRVGRVALQLTRGLAYAASGAGGVSSLQVLPSRALFERVLRDPVRSLDGEEQALGDSRTVFASDDAIHVSIAAGASPRDQLVLTIEETPDDGGPPLLAFAGGATATPVPTGTNTFAIELLAQTIQRRSRATLRVRTTTGRTLSSYDLTVVPHAPDGSPLAAMWTSPETVTLTPDVGTAQLGVAGAFESGLILNLTRGEAGSTYTSDFAEVATVDPEGLVSAVAGGTATIAVSNSGKEGSWQVTVQRPPRLIALEASSDRLTLRSAGEQRDAGIVARFSNGTVQDAHAVGGTAFRSSDPAIATVGPDGRITAVAQGDVTIVAENGTLAADVLVTNEFRTPAAISSIQLTSLPPFLSADEERVVATAVLSGTGSLDGHQVSFVSNGVLASTVAATSDLAGTAVAAIGPLVAGGTLTISASVVDPATGQLRSDSQTLTILPRTGDNEPNDGTADASPLGEGRTATGSVDATTDARDTYRLSTFSEGAVEITVNVGNLAAQSSLVVVVRNAEGSELARFPITAGTTSRSIQLPPGAASVTVEALSGAATYALSFKFAQAQPQILAVSPLSGPPGTLVTITGTGFSTAPEAVMVLFNGVAGRVTSVTSTTISVQVPANAANGALDVISGARQATGPVFTTGVLTEPSDFFSPAQPAFIRRLPDSGTPIVVNRLLVSFDPTVGRAAAEAVLQQAGAVVAGFDPEDNSLIAEFPNNTSLDTLFQRRRQLEANASVVLVTLDSLFELDASRRIDMRDYKANFAAAHEQIRLFQAVNAVRRSRLETDAFPTVRVAVLDDGIRATPGGDLDSVAVAEGPTPGTGDHGTLVAGVIGALNNSDRYSGALNSVKFPNESPFAVHAFTVQLETTQYLYKASVKAALKRIKARNRDGNSLNDIDVVNMSFGGFRVGAAIESERRFWRALLKPLEPRTLVVASAGNQGFHTFIPGFAAHYPSAMAFAAPPGGQPLRNVLSVGASTTPLSPGLSDERATFSEPWRDTFPCAGLNMLVTRTKESNCDPGLSLVAPGREVPSVSKTGASAFFQGTSASAPLVAAIAALLQASRQDFFVRMAPDDIATILQVTSDNISETWSPAGPGGSRRLNALGALRAVLPAPPPPNVYIADTDADVVVALSADPITGDVGSTAIRIPLTINRPDFQLDAKRPTTVAISPAGDRLFVAAENEFGNFGLVVINTDTLKPVHFIAVYVTACGSSGQTPMAMETLRPGMAFSQDGRILYVTNGTRLAVINTDTEEQVQKFARLPAPYNIDAGSPPMREIDCRLEDLHNELVTTGLSVPGGGANEKLKATAFGALEVSPDGRVLYLALQAGRGTGANPGAVIAVNINLYDDGDPIRPGLQPRLTEYLLHAFRADSVKSFQMPPDPPDVVVELARAIKGDEPSDVAVSPDGRFVYLLNGGVQGYSGAIPDDEALKAAIVTALGGVLVGAAVATGGNLYAAAAGAAIGGTLMTSALVHDILPEMIRFSKEVGVIVAAPGITAAFDTQSSPPGDVPWFYTATTAFGWVTGNDRLGFNADQRSFDQIFASRPFGMTMKRDGSRAIVSLFQTGNFAVLDESAQSFFRNVNTEFGGAPAGVFQGFVGVTPAIRFDQFLWPENEADERLLYPTAVEYAQNGRFAVGVHTGTGTAGAVTVLDDEAIGRDLAAHVGTLAPGFQRSYFAQVPICRSLDPATLRCSQDVFTRLFEYAAGDGTSPFTRPRGVAIDPFIVVEAPRFGDYVTIGSAVHVRWRTTAAVTSVVFEVEDLGTASAPTTPAAVGSPVTVTPNPLEALSQSLKAGIVAIFANNAAAPQDGHRYRITVRAILGSGDVLSETSVEVTFVDQ